MLILYSTHITHPASKFGIDITFNVFASIPGFMACTPSVPFLPSHVGMASEEFLATEQGQAMCKEAKAKLLIQVQNIVDTLNEHAEKEEDHYSAPDVNNV